MKGEPTYWNGERTPARRVRVRVGGDRGIFARPWWTGLEGTERKAVEVRYGDRTFFLDDEGGEGWNKVTAGHGSPRYGHSELPDDSTVISDNTASVGREESGQ